MDSTNAQRREIEMNDGFKRTEENFLVNSSIGVDFIEMLTLDANEFLTSNCFCKEEVSKVRTFCKDCFSNFKDAPDDVTQNVSDNDEPHINEECQITNNLVLIEHEITDGAKVSCELKNVNKGLLNGRKIDDEMLIIENNEEKQKADDDIPCKCKAVENSNDVLLKSDLNESELTIFVQNDVRSISTEAGAKKCVSINSNRNDDIVQGNSTLPFGKQVDLNQNPNIASNTVVAQSHSNDKDGGIFTDAKSSLLNKESHLNRNLIIKLNSPDLTAMETNLSPNLDLKNASHPTSVLQDLLNPLSTGPNSSETAPSRHQQESAHGVSCASRTSIETDGGWREQAPRCSRDFAADVGANDAFRRRNSQDNTAVNNFINENEFNSASSSLKLDKNATENVADRLSCDDDCADPRVVKERRQLLSWGFRNGRLVFAESKSDLGSSRLQWEQVVESSKNPSKAATNNIGNYFTESNEKLSGLSSGEAIDKHQLDSKLRSSIRGCNNIENKFFLTENSDPTSTNIQTTPEFDQNQTYNNTKHKLNCHDECNYQHPKLEQVADSDIESADNSTDGKHWNGLSKDILYSKDINRRLEDSNSRIKYLEDKLKKAGLIDQNFELLENNTKVFPCDVVSSLNLNTCKCAEPKSVQNSIVDLVLERNRNNCEPENLVADESKKQVCSCVSNEKTKEKNNILDDSNSSLSQNGSCACYNNQETIDLKEGAAAKNHLYKLSHNFDTTTVVSEENENLNAEDVSNKLKYIEYSVFQKENTATEKTGLDSNQNVVKKDNYAEGEDLIPEDSHGICEFDVNNFSGFSEFNVNGCYDEFIEDSSSDESCDCDEDDHFIVIRRMRGDGCTMVNEPDRTKHNPDRANLKSLLKKPGRTKDKKSNRVVFNENKNEFFDADYIILIREECDYDEDDDDGVCTCNQHEMVRLTCCEPNCNCQGYEGFEQTPQSPKFAPPIEFVDAVTLSPPEGYKDMELMAASRGQQRGAVCRECSATHEEDMEEEGEVCKQRWKTLRDGFQRAAKNDKTKSGQAAKPTKKWKYWDAMTFLLPFIKGRETHSNIDQETNANENDDDRESNSAPDQIQSDVEENHNTDDGDVYQSQPNTPVSIISSAKRVLSVNKKNTTITRKAETVPEILREYADDKKRSRLERQAHAKKQNEKDNPVLEFFVNMGKTVATFPPLWQATVKSQVFQIVNRLELQLLSVTSEATKPGSTSFHPQIQNVPPMHSPSNSSTASCYCEQSNLPPMQHQPPTHPSFTMPTSSSCYEQSKSVPVTTASGYYTTLQPLHSPSNESIQDTGESESYMDLTN